MKRRAGRDARAAVLAAGLVACCRIAEAHGSAKGLGNFFGGIVHPLIEPAHLIALIALVLVVGQRGPARSNRAVTAFALALIAGLGAAWLGWTPDVEALLLGVSLLGGLVVAATAAVPAAVVMVCSGVLGAGIGLDSRPDSASGAALAAALIGTGVGGVVWVLNGVELVMRLKRPWLQILVRVFGSWVAACSMLVLALWLGGPAGTAARHGGTPAMPLDIGR